MQAYIARRLLLILPTLFIIGLFTFLLVRLIPGDVLMARIAESGSVGSTISPEERQRLRRELGLDRPLPTQFMSWFGGAVQGDFGESLWTRKPVGDEIRKALEPTMQLGLMALILGWVIAIPAGIIGAIRRNSPLDYGARLFAVAGICLPDFWIGLMVILLLSRTFDYFPPMQFASLSEDPLANLEKLALPALILGVRLSAVTARMTRSAMLEVVGSDYIRTAWAKGLRERAVVMRHALRNALIPVITILGNQMSFIIGGTVIMETLFVIPGMGRLTVTAVTGRDYPQLQANILLLSAFILVANLLVDLSYAYLDPRVRLK
jgi:peptide/nickel transport system permease protein